LTIEQVTKSYNGPSINLGVIDMKKSLIALAALAASGFAMAQSSVTLFGTVDTNVTVVDGKNTVTGLSNSGIGSSAFGLRGVEDLGNGLKAGFWLESGINSDAGDGTAGGATGPGLEFARRSTLSLMGGFGELRMGRDLTVAYSAVSKYDALGTLGVGSTRMWSAPAGFQDVRRSNMLGYFSPSFGGFKLNANYAFGENVGGSARSGDTYALAALYDNGPLSLALAYQETNRKAYAGAEESYWTLGGSYDFGVVKLMAAYNDTGAKYNRNETALRKRDGSNYTVGVTAPVGAAGTVKFAYNSYKRDQATAGEDKANQYSLGYVHNLSKRTAVYTTYSYLKNKRVNGVAGQTFLMNGPSLGDALKATNLDNGKVQALQVGIRHNF
jgi:predicted porin